MSDAYGGKLRTFGRKKAGTSTFSNPSLVSPHTPTLANPTRGFGLPMNNVIQTATKESTNLQEVQAVDEQFLLSEAIGQRSFGHDISRIPLRRPQAKLTLGEPGDKYEQEADWMANQVMRMVVPDKLNAFSVQPVQDSLQRKCAACEQEEEKVQTKQQADTQADGAAKQRADVTAALQNGQMQPKENTIQRETTPEEKEKLTASQPVRDWTRSLPPKDEIPISKEQQDEIVNSIKRQRESVQDRLKTKDTTGLFKKGKGYEYDGDPHKQDSKPNFADNDARKTQINELVWQELAGEGSSAAINTYDSQQLTWGRGFAASGQLEAKMEILFQKDPTVKVLLFDAGFTYQGKNWLAVNTASGRIEEGNKALELIRTDVKVLSLLIEIAEDPQHSQNVVDAEFETIKGRAGNVPPWAYNWTNQAIQFAAHCVHWGGSWEQYHNTNGDIKEIARIKAQNAHSTHREAIRGGATLIKEGPTITFLSFAKGVLRGLVEGPSPLPDNIDVGPSNSIFFKTKSGQYYYLP